MDISDFLSQTASPTAYQIGQYGRTPVSYFHGLPQISVPLTEVRGRGITIPVSLSYHGGGIKAEQHPGWVGLGWSLHAGGCITRIVNGIKDEMSRFEYGHLHNTEPNSDPGYLYHASEIQDGDEWSSSDLYNHLYSGFPSYEPDEYILSAPGLSCSFVLMGNNELRVISRDSSSISLEEVHISNDGGIESLDMYPGQVTGSACGHVSAKRYKYIDRIVIRDSQGNRYVFGGDDAVEYSVVQYPHLTGSNSSPINSGNWDAVATATTWMLTRIERADGETVVFSYVRNGVPIILRDVHHGCVCASDDSSPSWFHTYYGVLGHSEDTNDTRSLIYKRNLCFSFLMPCYLSEIRCLLSGDVLSFETEDTTERGYEIPEDVFRTYCADLSSNYASGPFTYTQFISNDRYRKLVRIHGRCRDVRLDYTSDVQTRLKLTKVRILDGNAAGDSAMEWSFTYDPTPLPGYNSRQTDRWGYYNGRTYATGTFGLRLDEGRDPVEEKMKAEILTEVHYPTGGWTEYTWEPHEYGMRVLPPDFLRDTEHGGTAGGLRIASIVDHLPDGQPSSRTFTYSEGDVSSGVLSDIGKCRIMGDYSFRTDVLNYDGHFAMYSEQPILPLSRTDGCHVTYSTVRETFADGGYAEYQFSNNDSVLYRDQQSRISVMSTDVSPLYPRFTSAFLKRGLLLRKDVYRADGVRVSKELMEYADSSAQTYRSASLDRYVGGNIDFMNYSLEHCGYPAMINRTLTEYKDDGAIVSGSQAYTYNSLRLPASEFLGRISDSEESRTIYACDRNGGTYARMTADGFPGLPVCELKMRDGKVIEAHEISYRDILIPSLDGDRRTWRPSKMWTGRFASPVDFGTYNWSPMSYMDSTPDVVVRLFDDTSAPLFTGMKDGSATEWHWDSRHGLPGMVLKTVDRDFSDSLVSEQHDIVLSRQLIAEGSFVTTQATTFTCSLAPAYGYAIYAVVCVDDMRQEIVQWVGSEIPNDHWMGLIVSHSGSASMNLDAGEHRFSVRHIEWYGPGGTSGGTLRLNHYQARASEGTGAFLSLDDDSGTAEGFHCERGHSGPVTVRHDTMRDTSYVLDYMEKHSGEDWRYRREAYTGGEVTIGTTGSMLSNVRIYPEGSMPESYSFRDFVGMTARTDARGTSCVYVHDGMGRLSEERDNECLLMKEYSYLFATACGASGSDNAVCTTEYNYKPTGEAVLKKVISHLDGLGHPVQEAAVDAGGEGVDVVTLNEYDAVGRLKKTWVPAPVASGPGRMPGSLASEAQIVDGLNSLPGSLDSAPYTENIYETSPRDRVTSVIGPGQAWRGSGGSPDRGVTTDRLSNNAVHGDLLCHRGFSVDHTIAGMVLRRNGSVTVDGLLDVKKTTSEDGDVSLVFSNVHGEDVLTRRVYSEDGQVRRFADTHVIRDGFGRIAAVLPPNLTAQLEGEDVSEWNWSAVEEQAFLYRYDSRGNCIAKNIPGGGWTYMAYDKGGRCVFIQDAVQRETGKWSFRLTDMLGRECVNGTVTRSMDSFADPVAGLNIYASLPSSPDYTGTLKGYVLNGLSSLGSDVKILAVNYYDGYGFNEGDSATTYSEPSAGETYGRQSQLSAAGLMTGRLVRVLDGTSSETFVKDVLYYDDKARVIQKATRNGFGKTDREYLAYDFAGNVVKRKAVHGKPGTTSLFTETLTYTFDAMGRPLKTTHKAGTATSRTVVNRIYDSVGRLATLNRINPPVAALTQTYSYNVRSWLTAIGGTLFSEELDYCTGNSPRWDGKISVARWRNPSETAWRSYRYGYDGLSRLTEAEYDEAGWSGAFTERYGYDLNGNMTTRLTSSLLTLSYVGNRLDSSMSCTFTYDACGRLAESSAGRVRSTVYNEIGLPLEMRLSDGTAVKTVYAADGRKLSETVTSSGTSVVRRYSGNCIFEGSTLKKVLFEGGYAQMIGSSPTYMFFISDHLGSVRVVAAQNGTVMQVNQYSPFGELVTDSSVAASSSDNRYRFTGKELCAETLLHDFGARYLDTAKGRFTTIDPLAEKYPSVSPYVYCAGDPVNMVDSTGKFPIVANVIGAIAGAAIDYSAQVAVNLMAGRSTGKSIKEALTDIDYVDVAVSAAEGFLTMGASTVGKIVVKEAAVVVAGAFDYDNDTKQVKLNDSTKTMVNIALGHVVQPFNGPSVKVFKTTTPTKALNAAREKAHLKGHGLATSEAKKIAAKTRTNNLNVPQANKEISSMSKKSLDHAFSTGIIKYLDEK